MDNLRLYILFFTILFHFISCSKKADQNILDTIESANIFLTSRECDEAIKELQSIGYQEKNARYLIALASAYACKAGYSSTDFYGKNLDNLSSASDGFLGSLTKFTTSNMNSPTDPTFINLLSAITTLLYAGGVDVPVSVQRSEHFSSEEMQDMNIFNLYLILSTLGKYLFYYGNADPTTGTKGAGADANGNTNKFTNGCLYKYNVSDPDIQLLVNLALTNGLGSCTISATGSSKLFALPNDTTVKRMCQGVVLFNQLLDILTNTTMPGSGKSLVGLSDSLAELCSNVSQLGDICNVKSFSECEENYNVIPQTDQLQVYFFAVLESNF